jgi:hypothetical protein
MLAVPVLKPTAVRDIAERVDIQRSDTRSISRMSKAVQEEVEVVAWLVPLKFFQRSDGVIVNQNGIVRSKLLRNGQSRFMAEHQYQQENREESFHERLLKKRDRI